MQEHLFIFQYSKNNFEIYFRNLVKYASYLNLMVWVNYVPWSTESDEKVKNSETNQKPESIMDYLKEKAIGLAINLPTRSRGRSRCGSLGRCASMRSLRTKGHKFRRLAIELQVPLIADVKCAKLFVEVQ